MRLKLRHIILMLLCINASLEAWAETVTQREASRYATIFFNALYGNVMSKPKYVYNGKQFTTDRLFSPFYVYNHPAGGFVIIAADNKAFPILAYSRKESFDPNRLGDSAKALLSGYAREIELIRYDSRIPDEAIEQWSYYPEHLSEILGERYEASDPALSDDNHILGRKGNFYRLELDRPNDWLMRLSATEFKSSLLPSDSDSNWLDEETSQSEEEPPFTFYNSFINDIKAEKALRQAMLDDKVNPREPVVTAVGGGHFQIHFPEEIIEGRVFSLQGATIEMFTFKGTDTAVINLDAQPPGFYLALIHGKSGRPYGFKLYK